MKFCLAFIIILVSAAFVQGQTLTSKNKKAIKYYNEARTLMGARSFDKAFTKLEQALQKDPNFAEAYLKQATIYRIRKQDSLQNNCYLEVIKRYPQATRFASAWYYVGEYTFKHGEYETTKNYLQTYQTLTNQKGKYLQKAKLMLANCDFAMEYKTHKFEFNPRPLPPTVNKFKQQYFPVLTADQKTLIFVRRQDNEDLMVSTKNEAGRWQAPVSISEHINTTFNEGTCSISADGRKLVFTSCMGRKGYGSCDLYESIKVGDVWSKPKNMGKSINSTAWDSQPALSADGRTLYFVSNRKGGYGRRDIYVSFLNDNGTWTTPENAGVDINTPYDDISPFIHPNGQRLYFATDGRLGFGGFDIYFAEKQEEGWSKPINFGYPINTHNDEVSMFISSDGRKGYYSHEEKQGESFVSTLYEIDVPASMQVEHKSTYVFGRVMDKTNKKPLKASVSLIDLATETLIEKVASDSVTGNYLIVLTQGKTYGLFAEAESYLFTSKNFNLTNELLHPVEVNLLMMPLKTGAKMVLNNIFFGYNSYELTPASETELNKVIMLLKANPNINIKITGYTDNVGSAAFNLKLSSQRSKAVFDYLSNNGVPTKRMAYIGLGATQFVANNSTEQGRALNRRIEFEVVE